MGFKKGENPHHPKKGASIRVDPIRDMRHIQAIKRHLIDTNNMRDHCLFVMGLNTAWRANELLALKVKDVDSLGEGDILERKQSKTGKYRKTPLNRAVIRAIEFWLVIYNPASRDLPLFPSRQRGSAITVPTFSGMVKQWCRTVGAHGNFGAHSLRKSFGYHQRVTFETPTLILVEAFGHRSERQTLDYLGIQEAEIEALYAMEL